MSDNSQPEQIIELMQSVLGEGYADLRVKRVMIEEDLKQGTTSVTCEVTDGKEGEPSVIAAQGVGLVDAFFNGIVNRFAGEYPSLKTIQFASFHVGAMLETRSAFAGADSQSEVTVEIRNSEGHLFRFSHASRSLIASSIITTLKALEYFINSERAYLTLYEALRDAASRNRDDLVQCYTGQMAVLVRNTSYSEVIERLRKNAP
jgi:hypothetical protein